MICLVFCLSSYLYFWICWTPNTRLNGWQKQHRYFAFSEYYEYSNYQDTSPVSKHWDSLSETATGKIWNNDIYLKIWNETWGKLTIFYISRELLLLTMTVSMGMLIFAGLAYALEKDEPDTTFYTLPQTLYWAIITMTSTGNNWDIDKVYLWLY